VPEVSVVFDPEMLASSDLSNKTAVVIDVLRATTSMLAALAAGAKRVIPVGEVDEARALAATLPEGTAVLGGERAGLPIDGFDVGNTPQEFTPEIVAGKTVVMTTTNGTRAILMTAGAPRRTIAALTNVAATAEWLSGADHDDVVLVTSGTERRVSWEDTFCAGTIVERLADTSPEGLWHLTDSALIALEVWQSAKANVGAALRRGRGGRNVKRLGLEIAFDTCSALDSVPIVARISDDPLEIVADINPKENM
jgi:2-phosphosulfolactate phosphatase